MREFGIGIGVIRGIGRIVTDIVTEIVTVIWIVIAIVGRNAPDEMAARVIGGAKEMTGMDETIGAKTDATKMGGTMVALAIVTLTEQTKTDTIATVGIVTTRMCSMTPTWPETAKIIDSARTMTSTMSNTERTMLDPATKIFHHLHQAPHVDKSVTARQKRPPRCRNCTKCTAAGWCRCATTAASWS